MMVINTKPSAMPDIKGRAKLPPAIDGVDQVARGQDDDGAHEAQQQQRADNGEDRDRVEQPIGLGEHDGVDHESDHHHDRQLAPVLHGLIAAGQSPDGGTEHGDKQHGDGEAKERAGDDARALVV